MAKISNSKLFRAMKWLTENTENITLDRMDGMTNREIMSTYEMQSALFTVEYDSMGRTFVWRGSTYGEAVRRVACVVKLGYSPEVWRESDRECVTREFTVPAWL